MTNIDCSDKATIERLYAKMSRAAIAKAQSIVRRGDLAAEIAHDAFIKLWQGGGQFPSEKAVYAWIFKTCHRAAIDHLRSAAHKREHYSDDDAETFAAPGGPASGGGSSSGSRDAVMTRQLVTRYLADLTDEEAEAFLYVALDGMTQVEVAEMMGLSRRTVQRIMERVEERFAARRRNDDS
jgi:RNA polymerase sigma-70 factor (ECF subfamily)